MYKAYFKLQSNPFSPTPPPDFIYQSKELKEALAHFSFALENREAFLLLTGEVGTGKTTAVQSVLRLLPEGTPVALVTHTTLEPRELLEEVALRFGLENVSAKSKPVLIRELEEHFELQWAEGRQSLLILDEAHLLKPDVLEEVRLLSNLEREGGKLVQICLVGQPELIAHLQRPELRQLRQRISVRYALRPLSESETRDYVIHRLRAAGSPDPNLVFTDGALKQIHHFTHGIPREINVIAGQGLVNAYVAESGQVLPEHVSSVHEDFGFEGLRQVQEPVSGPEKQRPAPPPVTKLRSDEEEDPPPPPPPGLKQRPIPLPPEHLRPKPRREPERPSGKESPPPAPVPMSPPVSKTPRAQGEPVAMKSSVKSRRRSSASRSGTAWIPWALIIVVGLVLAWKFWVEPAMQQSGASPEQAEVLGAQTDADSRQAGGEQTGGGTEPQAAGGGNPDPVVDSLAARADSAEAVPATATASADPITPEIMDRLAESGPDSAGLQGRDWSDAFMVDSRIRNGGYAGGITGQVASMRGAERTNGLLAEIERRTGLPAVGLPTTVNGREWFRVLVGRFASPAEAREALTPLLEAKLITEVMIIPVPAGAAGLGSDAP